MATIVLQVVGAAIGGAIGGPFGATIGRAVGAAAGYAIDQQIFQKDQVITGPRLDRSRFLSSNNGAPIPRVYGRTQIGGQIIWATRFEEVRSQIKQGGKGSPPTKVTEFSYFGNFAIGICAGPVSNIGRIWADGTELDLTKFKYRTYSGAQNQQPDPLIEALQLPGNTPAYRGLAYVVFEDFPLASFGNRIPQLTFEVIRSVGKLEQLTKSICVIPGSTAFGYSPTRLIANDGDGNTINHNRHTLVAESDWSASINELQALCPNLESVSLVVAWFGNDLRAEHCQLMPGVERPDIYAENHSWVVSGITPTNAHQISQIGNRPAFGSTPTDQSVIEAITDLYSRGLKVTFYPFQMMDIAPGNSLPDPEGNSSQPAYPWRGQITCFPAIGQPASADQTSQSTTQIAAFTGTAAIADFTPSGNTVNFTGASQWSYRRMILHYAHLCVLAGGVDNFIIGSELKALTSVRDDTNAFPFVQELISIAGDAGLIFGSGSSITYAADWSEYFGYHPQDGSNDLYFNLDPLWASSSIDAIGLDNYMPIADWRSNGDPQDGAAGEYSAEYFTRNIAGGEGFDWYYASDQDRQSATRTPITDGNGEPWVWRFKDLHSWWSNPHHERVNGTRSSTPTQWQSQSKPFWFTELGCPAINKGANQPNVFYDDKSSQSAVPHFSTGHRDDLAQRIFLQAHLEFWSDGPQVDQNNPLSNVYAGRMVDTNQISLWAWDARPFPAFPMHQDIWSDSKNWMRGHWLNARIGSCPLDDLVAQILQDYSFSQYDVNALPGWVNGFVIPNQAPARQVLEPLLGLFGASATSDNGKIRFFPGASIPGAILTFNDLVEKDDLPTVTVHRSQETDLPKEAIIHHDEIRGKIESVASKSRRLESQSERQIQMQLPAVLPADLARHLADSRVRDAWIGRDGLQIFLPPQSLQFAPGDAVSINDDRYNGLWQIQAIEDGYERQLDLKRIELPFTISFAANLPSGAGSPNSGFGKPLVLLLDIPLALTSITHPPKLVTAVTAEPWAGNYAYASSPDQSGFEIRKTSSNRATIAKLIAPLSPGPESRWDYANILRIAPVYGGFVAKSSLLILNGANALAVQTNDGNWEIVQFRDVVLENDGTFSLSTLLRGQLGTEPQMAQGSDAGNHIVLLDQQVETIDLVDLEKNLPLYWRIGPSTDVISSDSYYEQTFTFTDRASKPFSPVHIEAVRLSNDDLAISWKRRSRVYGDDWDASEIPLGETMEAYHLKIFNGQNIVREFDATATNAIYLQADQMSDFASLPQSLSLTIAQLDASNNPGSERSAILGPFS